MNKLGLTGDDRLIQYDRDGSVGVGELRHFDPIAGLLKLYDPLINSLVEFLYDHTNSQWKSTGDRITWTCDWHFDDVEIPVEKQEDRTTGVSTISRL